MASGFPLSRLALVSFLVVPTKVGSQAPLVFAFWVPAVAGMTEFPARRIASTRPVATNGSRVRRLWREVRRRVDESRRRSHGAAGPHRVR